MADEQELAETQRQHWQDTYTVHPGMYGEQPSAPAVHFFDRDLVDALANGWALNEIHAFEEGDLPRRLWRITQTLPR
ncbi:hypothetical protein KBZ21_20675 [Streptomyces sp. A73]|nr:hypothetical protein [Streptomyces sp. A73]